MKTLLLVDGNGIMHRAYHAIPPFKTTDGKPTNALYGFFSILHREISYFKPSHVTVCFDTPTPTFRKKMFIKYQAHRPKADDEFRVQIPYIQQAVDKAGITRVEKEGYEGDDVIGTVAKKFGSEGKLVIILSGDRDILQLVNNNIIVISPQNGFSKNLMYDINEVKKRFGIDPSLIPQLKGLMGDPSDNYPGAKGIGPKTAATLINNFHTIDNLYKNLSNIANERIKKILIDNKENVFISRKLATILTDIDIDFDIDKTEFDWFKPELKDYLLTFEMKSLVNRIFVDGKKIEVQKSDKPVKPKKEPEDQMGLF